MNTYTLNLRSRRVRRARLSVGLHKGWLRTTSKVIVPTSIISSAALLATDQPIGWLTLLPATWAGMYLAWDSGDLALRQATGKPGDTQLENLLEFELLAALKSDNPSAYDVWKAISKTEARYFVGNRYQLPAEMLEELLNKNPGSADGVWADAAAYQQTHGLNGISNAAVMVALVKSIPGYDQLLSRMELDLEDIETAIPWLRDIEAKRRLIQASKSLGGIGRDWAYGYTPLLRYLGHNISEGIQAHGFFSDTAHHANVVDQMIQNLSTGNATATLVGDTGVGKTTCVYTFAERLLEDRTLAKSVRFNQVIELDAPTLIANAKNPGQLEELMLRILREAQKAKNITLFFDDAEAFFGSGPGTVDLSHVLQPALESTSVRIVLAMTPAAWQRLAASSSIGRLQPINVKPADEDTTLAVLRDSISLAEYKNKSVFTYQALQEGYKLASRYATAQAMPGAALSLLEQVAVATPNSLITRASVQASVEQTYGIKIQTAQGGDESQKLLSLESELHKYVINQDRAVTVVADALRRSRSGVGNPNRPVGTFLFLGPTGVGKTELSKALARVYFGDEAALIRVDMNQYVGADDVARLIQPMAGGELGFLGRVRKAPFSVILLDEIEKAHSSVVNALLQMLDEGVMRDSDSKNVSFKDAIIIATSNAGADQIREMVDSGKDMAAAEAEFVETLISRGSFAPEFINRFDEVVVFKPLTPDELVRVVDLIMDGVNQTLSARKVSVELTDAAKTWLVEKGYDPKLGARPMRRMVQRYVENTVAKKLLDQSTGSGGVIKLDIGDLEK